MKAQAFTNVWGALENDREDAATMTIRSKVMIAINSTVRSWDVTQASAA